MISELGLSIPNFSTVTDNRVRAVSLTSEIQWAQVFVTGKCNMTCRYCRRFGRDSKDITIGELSQILDLLGPVRKLKLTGGEPTCHPDIADMISLCSRTAREVSIGTNGSASAEFYSQLVKNGLTSATVSVDRASQTTPLSAISTLSKNGARVVAGITVDGGNSTEIDSVVSACIRAGAADVTLSVSTEYQGRVVCSGRGLPILSFRSKKAEEGRTRGGMKGRCYMAMDSVAIKDGEHYGCQIQMRENGVAIGKMKEGWREARGRFMANDICEKYCPDFCREFNEACGRFYE